MNRSPKAQSHSLYPPLSTRTGSPRGPAGQPASDEPPRKPDWLLIMVGILFLLTLLIGWLAGIPITGR